MKKEVKTNAMRILDRNKLKYTEHMYECDGFTDGITISDRLGQPYEKVFKTLVTVSKSKKYYVFVVPVAEELNLKKAAAAVGEKSVEMIYVKDITAITGYVRGGCSPIGMKKQFDTVIDITAKEQETIIFSGGRLGTQIEMNPVELAELINAEFADIKH
ncbi:MAG: Cys-tRNA(Pro) deacylase [Monoglobaceae bacterium]